MKIYGVATEYWTDTRDYDEDIYDTLNKYFKTKKAAQKYLDEMFRKEYFNQEDQKKKLEEPTNGNAVIDISVGKNGNADSITVAYKHFNNYTKRFECDYTEVYSYCVYEAELED